MTVILDQRYMAARQKNAQAYSADLKRSLGEAFGQDKGDVVFRTLTAKVFSVVGIEPKSTKTRSTKSAPALAARAVAKKAAVKKGVAKRGAADKRKTVKRLG
ncbi:MAG: hypothetical protein KF723_08515 [Rhizobiaceae bacterium]|nr:hypothetical protein [Rhizobiaceae bacterium]